MIYYFEQRTSQKLFTKYELGNPQMPYSYELTHGQGKSNVKFTVQSTRRDELKPFTIILDTLTNLWWCVKQDQSTYIHTPEQNLYEHEIECNGAEEWLNSFTIFDCAFKANAYTYQSFMFRLYQLAKMYMLTNFGINYSSTIPLTKKVDKFFSFENYKYGNAIRDLFMSINGVPKVTFIENGTYLTGYTITFASNLGLSNTPINITALSTAYEKNTSTQEKYATTIVSNLQNAQASDTVRFPKKFGAYVNSDSGAVVDRNDCFIQLPTKANRVDKIEVYYSKKFFIMKGGALAEIKVGYENDRDKIYEIFLQNATFNAFSDDLKLAFYNKIPQRSFYEVISTNQDTSGDNYVFMPNTYKNVDHDYPTDNQIYLKPKFYRDMIENKEKKERCMYWTQGDNKIQGFFWTRLAKNWYELNTSNGRIFTYAPFTFGGESYSLDLVGDPVFDSTAYSVLNDNIIEFLLAVTYVPQADLTVAYDNDNIGQVTNYFNQTGKIVDTKLATKLISSYVDQSASSSKVRKARYYAIGDIIPVGSKVYESTNSYLVSSESINVFNDMYDVVYSLSKDIIARDENVKADGNIKDTDIPSKNNVLSRILYRDYIELDYTSDSYIDTPYLPLSTVFHFATNYIGFDLTATAFMEIVNVDTDYYYMLDTYNYDLERSKMVVVDFPDNNYIGIYRERNISLVQTPLNYVDSSGNFDYITIKFANPEPDISDFMPYSNAPKLDYDYYGDLTTPILTLYSNIMKDAYEIPSFAYQLQGGNNLGISFGSNAFVFNSINKTYASGNFIAPQQIQYVWIVSDTPIDENTTLTIPTRQERYNFQTSTFHAIQSNSLFISYNSSTRAISMTIRTSSTYTEPNPTVHVANGIELQGKNVAIVAVEYGRLNNTSITSYTNCPVISSRLLFYMNNVRVSATSSLTLYVNNWKR